MSCIMQLVIKITLFLLIKKIKCNFISAFLNKLHRKETKMQPNKIIFS